MKVLIVCNEARAVHALAEWLDNDAMDLVTAHTPRAARYAMDCCFFSMILFADDWIDAGSEAAKKLIRYGLERNPGSQLLALRLKPSNVPGAPRWTNPRVRSADAGGGRESGHTFTVVLTRQTAANIAHFGAEAGLLYSLEAASLD